jgi:ParB-like chromosome segregation protein Spo0J
MAERPKHWAADEVRHVPLECLDERLQRYRLHDARRERQIGQSLERYGQLAPVVVCLWEEAYVLIDGFKRVRAARNLRGLTQLQARRMEVDEQGAKAAIYTLNRLGQP